MGQKAYANQVDPWYLYVMQSSANTEPMTANVQQFTATRWATNHDWCRRGDNTKYKAKK
jgi:hypothetical protein